jgi:hypothetical protein
MFNIIKNIKRRLKMNKIAIVIQGPSLYVKEAKKAWSNFKDDLIFSTWEGFENEYNSDDIVIFNEDPKVVGNCNFNRQKVSSYTGLLKAKNLGYTHALKIRSDYLPTNDIEFVKLLDFNKMNFLLWDYASFLWLRFPTFTGYLTDHFVFGPIDEMIELWNIKDNFCSAQTMITWSYIDKLSSKIDIHYLLPYLNENNNIFYIKPTATESYGFFDYQPSFSDRILRGRYESYFQTFRLDSTGKSEYTMSPEETKKFMNDKYLNFLRYYNPLPKVSIIDNSNRDFSNIIYPKNKLEIISNIDDITGEYVILSENIKSNADIIIEYFKKINTFYDGTLQNYITNNDNTITWENPGNYIDEYKQFSVGESNLLTKNEFFWNKSSAVDLDFLEIGTSDFDTLIEISDDDTIGISVEPIKYYQDRLPNKKNVLKVNKAITGDNVVNTKIKIYYIPLDVIIKENLPEWLRGCNSIGNYHFWHIQYNIQHLVKIEYVDLISIDNFLKEKKIRKIKHLQIDTEGHDTNILHGLYRYISNLPDEYHPDNIMFETNDESKSKDVDDLLKLYYNIDYTLVYRNSDTYIKKNKK